MHFWMFLNKRQNFLLRGHRTWRSSTKTTAVNNELRLSSQTNGTDTTAKKSASLTGKQSFLSSTVRNQPCSESFIETETSPSSKLIIRDIYATLGLSSHRRIIYNHVFFPAEKGIKLVQEGQYAQAVTMFTEAIKCDPKDNRCFICGLSILRDYLCLDTVLHCTPALFNCTL